MSESLLTQISPLGWNQFKISDKYEYVKGCAWIDWQKQTFKIVFPRMTIQKMNTNEMLYKIAISLY